MCADDESRGSAGDGELSALFLGGRQTSDEKGGVEVFRESAERRSHGPRVLGREHFGGGDERRLPTVLNRRQHRTNRDKGLTRTNLALNQPIHRAGAGHVVVDFGSDCRLVCRQRVRQRRVELRPQCARGSRHRHGLGGTSTVAQQCRLNEERLVKTKGLSRGPPLVVVGGTMNVPNRVGVGINRPRHANLVWHGVGQFRQGVDDHTHRLRNLPGRHRARRGIDRNRRLRPQFRHLVRHGVVLVEQLVIGMRQLALTAELAHLSRKDSTRARAQRVRPPRLVEKRQRQRSGPVRDYHLE